MTKEEAKIQDALGTLEIASITVKKVCFENGQSDIEITVIGTDPIDVVAKFKAVASAL